MRELERRVVLSVLDRKWREHLYEMDYLREGIGLRAMAQRDPLVEYQREGFDLFAAMMDGIKEESVGFVFNLEVEVEEASAADEPAVSPDESMPFAVAPEIHAKGLDEDHDHGGLQYSAPTLDGGGGGGTATQVTATAASVVTGSTRGRLATRRVHVARARSTRSATERLAPHDVTHEQSPRPNPALCRTIVPFDVRASWQVPRIVPRPW